MKSGRQLHIPVAICVSKIDMMFNQPYAGLGKDKSFTASTAS